MRVFASYLLLLLAFPVASLEIPSGTQIYLTTNDSVEAKGDNVIVGMLVRSRVSRDVSVNCLGLGRKGRISSYSFVILASSVGAF